MKIQFETEIQRHSTNGGIIERTIVATKYGTCENGFIFKLPDTIKDIINVKTQKDIKVIIHMNEPIITEAIYYKMNEQYFFKVTDSKSVKKILENL